jgi:hypothetical protein
VKPAVSGLEQAFPGQVAAHNVDASEPQARAAIADLGFKSHGLVIRSRDGEVLWSQADHTVRIEDVRAALGTILTREAS